MSTKLLDGALRLAQAGLRVFPCVPGDKRPLISKWPEAATSEQDTINHWWARWPDANIGLPTGGSNGVFVVDVDVKGPTDGFDSLAKLEAEFGDLPSTYRVDTPSGGAHLYFRYPSDTPIGNRTGFRPNLDIRGQRGYVVAPPSLIDGAAYQLATKSNSDIAEAPQWLIEVVCSRGNNDPVQSPAPTLAGMAEGTRNNEVFRFASSLLARGALYDEAKILILEKARNCNPALPEKEALSCLDSAFRRYTPTRPLTDLGNAERLVDSFGAVLRYVPSVTSWYTLEGHLWLRAKLGEIDRFAKATVRSISDEAKRESDPERAKELLKHAKRSENSSAIRNLLDRAAFEPGISINAGDLDADDFLFGVANGVLNLKTGDLIDDAPSKLVTMAGDVEYDSTAECPAWLRFLDNVTGGDIELQGFLQRCVGYSMIGGNPEQIVAVLHGTGANGKSTFLRTVQRLFGTYSKAVDSSLFMVQRYQSGGGPREDILRLRGARLALATELGEGQVMNEDLVKKMTVDDVLAARAPYSKETVEFVPRFTPWVATNHKPIVRGDDYAIWRRIVLIPFAQKIPAPKRDRFLGGKLAMELPGILNWALEGCLQWQKGNDLVIPRGVRNATKDYRSEMDLLEEWIESCCEVGPEFQSASRDLYESYMAWCRANNETRPIARTSFGRKISDRGYESCKIKQARSFRGIRPKPQQLAIHEQVANVPMRNQATE